MANIPTSQHDLRKLVQVRRRGIYIYALPNMFTAANFLLGFLSILFTVDQKFLSAAWAILLGSVFDMLDGRVARLTNTTSKFGVEFDSLCDLVSFGVAPAILLYYISMQPFNRLGIVAALIYGLCGALRLARFNVLSEVLPKSYFQGLPIPMASMVVATGVLLAKEMEFDLKGRSFVLVLSIALGLLMVSTIKFPSFKDFHLRQRRPFTLIASLFAFIVMLVTWFEYTAFFLIAGYIALSVILDLWRSRRKWTNQTNII